MSQEDIENADLSKPIIELDEKKTMPVHMLVAEVAFVNPPLVNVPMNVMITILHQKETDMLEIRGRVRFNETGNKFILNGPKTFNVSEFEEAKKEAMHLYQKGIAVGIYQELEPAFLMDFEIGESCDNIVKKMNDSDKFNIGVIPKP